MAMDHSQQAALALGCAACSGLGAPSLSLGYAAGPEVPSASTAVAEPLRVLQQAGGGGHGATGPGVPMSLTIRAARNLPIPLLAEEFRRILMRRHAKVGGG